MRWTSIRGRQCLLIEFYGRLTSQEAVRGGDEMKAEIEAAEGAVTIVWDCRQMASYEAMAFAAWKQRLSRVANLVDEIHCVTESSFIRLGASALGMAIRKSIKIAPSLEELEL